jgi:CheY-like chemotaxis protein
MAKILIVDDDPMSLKMLTYCLKGAGHEVSTAGSGPAALYMLYGGLICDLLLTDVMMPELSGFDLARVAKLRSQELRVLYMTAFDGSPDILGDNGPRYGKLLRKPVMPDHLTWEIDAALAA